MLKWSGVNGMRMGMSFVPSQYSQPANPPAVGRKARVPSPFAVLYPPGLFSVSPVLCLNEGRVTPGA